MADTFSAFGQLPTQLNKLDCTYQVSSARTICDLCERPDDADARIADKAFGTSEQTLGCSPIGGLINHTIAVLSATGPNESQQDSCSFDPSDLLAKADGKLDLVRRLLLGFRDQYASVGSELMFQLRAMKLEEARHMARSLHGVAVALCAGSLAECAERLASLMQAGDTPDARLIVRQIEASIEPILQVAADYERREQVGLIHTMTGKNREPLTAREQVLIIDDEQLMRDLLEDVLGEDYAILLAVDGAAGLSIAGRQPPDLILLDVDLPGLDGYSILRRLRENNITRDVPVIFVTGSSDIASETIGLELGAVDYVTKPISPAILKARVDNQIRLKRAEAEGRRRADREHYTVLVTEFERSAILEASRKSQLKVKDEFLSHVSHELRAPAASILAFVSLVIDGLAGEVTPQQVEYLGIAVRNVEHLKAMIEDLLEATRVGTGKLSVQASDNFIPEAVDYAVKTVSPSAEQKSIRLSSQLPSDLPSCLCDQIRLRQTLTILLDNAVKFTPPDGSVTVRARIFEQDSRAVLVEVVDSGCGIPPDKVGSVFDRLYQCASPDERGRGLGLGLHIAQELVQRQGGKIWVDSVAGVGSTFRFTLPISQPKD